MTGAVSSTVSTGCVCHVVTALQSTCVGPESGFADGGCSWVKVTNVRQPKARAPLGRSMIMFL